MEMRISFLGLSRVFQLINREIYVFQVFYKNVIKSKSIWRSFCRNLRLIFAAMPTLNSIQYERTLY